MILMSAIILPTIKISFLLGDTERLLATILITNNFVNVTIIMLCNFFFMNVFVFHSPLAEFLILTVILTFLLLLFGEIMPKIYSAQKTLAFCRFSAPGIYFLGKGILSDCFCAWCARLLF